MPARLEYRGGLVRMQARNPLGTDSYFFAAWSDQGTPVQRPWPKKFQKVSARQSRGGPLREATERNAKASPTILAGAKQWEAARFTHSLFLLLRTVIRDTIDRARFIIRD